MQNKIQPPGSDRLGSKMAVIDRAARSVLLQKLSKLEHGQITIEDGATHVLGQPSHNGLRPVQVSVKDSRAYRKMIFAGTTGLAEA